MTVRGPSSNVTVPKRAFTLIELVIGLAIGSLILALIYNFLSTSLNLSTSTIKQLNRVDDVEYALNYVSDEINGSKYIIEDGEGIIFYTYDRRQSDHHRYHHYFIKDQKLYRRAVHLGREDKKIKINDIRGGKNLILENVENFNFELNGEQLLWRMTIDGREYEFYHWLRGK